jgi:hypothetical protein
MGKGKGSFDHWASRIAVSKVIFELKGDIHEQVARDAFRLAGNKMPGQSHLQLHRGIGTLLTILYRPVRVCEEGRPRCGWNYKVGWHHNGGVEETSKKDSFGRDTHWPNGGDDTLVDFCVFVTRRINCIILYKLPL